VPLQSAGTRWRIARKLASLACPRDRKGSRILLVTGRWPKNARMGLFGAPWLYFARTFPLIDSITSNFRSVASAPHHSRISHAALVAAVLVAKMGPLTPMRVPSGSSQRILNLTRLALIALVRRRFMPAPQSAAWRPLSKCYPYDWRPRAWTPDWSERTVASSQSICDPECSWGHKDRRQPSSSAKRSSKSWKWRSNTPARSQAFLNPPRISRNLPPVLFANTRSEPGRRGWWVSREATIESIGIWRGSPFFESGIRINPEPKSRSRSRRLRISPSRIPVCRAITTIARTAGKYMLQSGACTPPVTGSAVVRCSLEGISTPSWGLLPAAPNLRLG